MIMVLDTADFHLQSQDLANTLQLPLQNHLDPEAEFYFYYKSQGLYLMSRDLNLGPLHLDFNEGLLARRLVKASLRTEPLARAIGLAQKPNLQLCDATAGIGRESALLARLGARVTSLERSKILSALVKDALYRCQSPWISHLNWICEDSRDFLKTSTIAFDVIYLDPMFEKNSHKARVKKDMQYLQALHADEEDADELLDIALSKNIWRVVVKRPLKARCLLDRKPDFQFLLPAYRFDVYQGGF